MRAKGIRLVHQGGRYGLLQEGARAATEVPAEVGPLVAWVLERREFSRNELTAAFPGRDAAEVERLLRELGAMRLIEIYPEPDLTGVACSPHCGNFVALSPDSRLMRRPSTV